MLFKMVILSILNVPKGMPVRMFFRGKGLLLTLMKGLCYGPVCTRS